MHICILIIFIPTPCNPAYHTFSPQPHILVFFFLKNPLSPISKSSLLICSWTWGHLLGHEQPTSGHGPRKNPPQQPSIAIT